jgi:hypothetical protein
MRKLWLPVFIVVGVLLAAACGQAKPTVQAKPTILATIPVATEDASTPKMDCQVVSMTPTQGPTEVSMFPPPDKDDWVLGKNANASLTITEYSDFQ